MNNEVKTPAISTRLGVTNIEGGMATVSEALQIAGANWEVSKQPIYDGFFNKVEGFSRIVRSDLPEKTMHICKNSYEPINNSEVFGIMDQILGESQALIERVGCIKDGRVVFMQAKVPERIEVLKGDGMDMYLNAITSHDGSYLAKVFFSAKRIICQNQLRALAKQRCERSISIRHTKNAGLKISTAGDVMMAASKEWEAIKDNAKILAEKSVNREQTKAFINAIFPKPEDYKSRDMNFTKREKIAELIECGMGTDIPGVKGSAYGLYNAATEYLEHYSSVKGDTSRYARSLLSGDKIRDEAFELAMSV